jgi:hypothetical protein
MGVWGTAVFSDDTACDIRGEYRDLLERWQEEPLARKRRGVLEKLRQQLLSAQPRAKEIPKRFRNSCDWEVGEFIGYRLKSGRWIILRVTGHHTDKGGTSPTFEILRFVGEVIPAAEQLHGLPVWKWGAMPDHSQLTIGRSKERDLPFDRVKRLGIKDGQNCTRVSRLALRVTLCTNVSIRLRCGDSLTTYSRNI